MTKIAIIEDVQAQADQLQACIERYCAEHALPVRVTQHLNVINFLENTAATATSSIWTS